MKQQKEKSIKVILTYERAGQGNYSPSLWIRSLKRPARKATKITREFKIIPGCASECKRDDQALTKFRQEHLGQKCTVP